MGVTFEDNSENCKKAIKAIAISFLNDIGGEIRSIADRNSRRKSSQTADSYNYRVDEEGLAVHIGSNYWNAIYEEFGTGEHAINGDGRKGYWVFVDTGGQPKAPKGGKTYTLHEAIKVREKLKKEGLDAHITKGKKANRPLFRAFESNKGKIQSIAEKYFGGI